LDSRRRLNSIRRLICCKRDNKEHNKVSSWGPAARRYLDSILPARHIDNAMVKAIARAVRWREMLENGTYATIAESAAADSMRLTWGRMLRLTLLAPDIVEAIRSGRQPAEVTLAGLMRPVGVRWTAQRSALLRSP
jgi:hypothetical protein